MRSSEYYIVQKQVGAFRRENKLGPHTPIKLKKLISELKILTLFRPLSGDFSGMCLKDCHNNRFMLINSNQSIGRQNFTIGHEFYHLFVESNPTPHKCNPGGRCKNKAEKNADMFSSILLMPEEGIIQKLSEEELKNKSIDLATIVKLEQYFSVSRSALLYRLLNLKLITKDSCSDLLDLPVKKTARKYGYSEELYEPANKGLFISDYESKAKLLLEKELISGGHYLELLNKISIDGED